jgi:hypothetical protein
MNYFPLVAMYVGGVIFGLGLAIAGAARPEVTLSFLRLEDLGLALVIGVALLLTLFSFQVVPRLIKKPLFGNHFTPSKNAPVTRRAIVGAVIFGIGWGISGLCPATSFAALGMGNTPVLYGVGGMFFGALVYGMARSARD